MKRGIATSGSQEHIELVKLATKRIVDSFENLRYIQINYEQSNLSLEIKIRDKYEGYTNASFEFRPDILLRAENRAKGLFAEKEKKWESIFDSSAIVFECETDPRNIFANVLKMEAYRKIKGDVYGRSAYAFVLVCWSDAELPECVEPFDEVWRFDKFLIKKELKRDVEQT